MSRQAMHAAALVVAASAAALPADAGALDLVRNCRKLIEEKRLANSTNDMNKVPLLVSRSWFLGYLSGRAGAAGKDFLEGTDTDSIFLWLDNYCQAHPDAALDKAGSDLAGELAKLKSIKLKNIGR